MMKPVEAFKAVVEYPKVFNALANDVVSLLKPTSPEHADRDRRSLIRAMFAVIDTDLFHRKQQALLFHLANKTELSDAELACLKDESYYVSDDGVAKSRPYFPPLRGNLRFTFSVHERTFGVDQLTEFEGEGWQLLLRTIKVRHRLTHSKGLSDIAVSDEELVDAISGYEWYYDKSLASLNRVIETMRDRFGKEFT